MFKIAETIVDVSMSRKYIFILQAISSDRARLQVQSRNNLSTKDAGLSD